MDFGQEKKKAPMLFHLCVFVSYVPCEKEGLYCATPLQEDFIENLSSESRGMRSVSQIFQCIIFHMWLQSPIELFLLQEICLNNFVWFLVSWMAYMVTRSVPLIFRC